MSSRFVARILAFQKQNRKKFAFCDHVPVSSKQKFSPRKNFCLSIENRVNEAPNDSSTKCEKLSEFIELNDGPNVCLEIMFG